MTILTKPSDVKKPEKTVLVPDVEPAAMEAATAATPLPGRGLVMIRSRRASSQTATLLLFLLALLVMCIGIIGGIIIYRQYAMQKWNSMRFHSLCRIPYDTESMDNDILMAANRDFADTAIPGEQEPWFKMIMDDLNTFAEKMMNEAKEFEQNLEDEDSESNATDSKFLQEEVDLDISDEESYSKINVPKLSTGRDATFLHDFKEKQTGIIDKAAKRCFVMPLDTDTVMAPKDLADLIQKIHQGYYNINTNVLRKTMRVKVPAITDFSDISSRIVSECKGMNMYELEKLVSGVAKRSVNAQISPMYSEFSGLGFNEYNINNLAEIEAFENTKN